MPAPRRPSAPAPTPSSAPWALYTPDADAILADRVGPDARRWAALLAGATEAQLRASDARPHRALLAPIVAAAGHEGAAAATLRGTLDLLQVVVDATDNLTDIEEDAARGVDRVGAYKEIPRGALHALPALVLACATDALHAAFPAPAGGAAAARRLLSVLDAMAAGQAAPRRSRARVEGSSGAQGAVAALPLWVLPADAPLRAHVAATERWGERFWATSERWQRVLDAPRSPSARRRLAESLDATRRDWPAWGPFAPGGPLDPSAVLPAHAVPLDPLALPR
jgi:hypothetical protein